jgi:hypothetical protein
VLRDYIYVREGDILVQKNNYLSVGFSLTDDIPPLIKLITRGGAAVAV